MKKIIAGNWKMNLTVEKAVEFVEQLKNVDCAGADVIICPPFTFLHALKERVEGSNIFLGAQNVSWAQKGAYTGEISPDMLKELNVKYVIIGHSERRAMMGESDQTVNMRLKNALNNGLIPIMCVGESQAQREQGQTEQVLKTQLRLGLDGISDISTLIVAYEPVWAIGTSLSATNEQANEAIGFIKRELELMYGKNIPFKALYGGSMTQNNCAGLLSQPNIDGGLIGGASLKINDFIEIINKAN